MQTTSQDATNLNNKRNTQAYDVNTRQSTLKMADVEKGSSDHVSMPPPPAYQAGGRQSFNPVYSHFVNDNMRNMRDEQGAPAQAFDQIDIPKRSSKFPSKKHQLIFFAIGCLLILALTLIGIFVQDRHHGDKDIRDAPAAEAVTITQTATRSSTSSPSISMSVSVSTVISKTTKIKTTTVATTAPIPKSIADAASSFYEVALASIYSDIERGQSIQSAALTKYPATGAPPTTLMTITTPPLETVVQTTTAPSITDAVTTTTEVSVPITPGDSPPSTTTLRNWINFCGVPGQACG